MIKRIIVIQFALELQWILRLAFSPMQLDFESAPFSHLGTSPNSRVLYQRKREKSRLLFRNFQHLSHFSANRIIVLTTVGFQTI